MLPENKLVQFSESPEILFNIGYALAGNIQMDIFLKNNLSSSIYLLNLWIQVNKSDSNEKILVDSTKIIGTTNILSLSTFDTDESMIFHLKLYEGEIIDPNEEYTIILSWDDPDNIYAQYDQSLLYNDINDDIQAYFQYSLEAEEPQLFPLIEREFYQIDGTEFCVDFRVTNLMATDLEVFDFTYVKIKDYSFENYLDLEIESPFLTSSEISNIELHYNGFSNRIEYKVSFSQNVLLEPDEWFKIKTRWRDEIHKSTIEKDLVMWNTGEDDPFNYGYPFYNIGFPFYPILSPAEPILNVDYDGDGLRNFMEITENLDPFTQEPWLVWQALRSEHIIESQYAKDLELGATILIFIPSDFNGKNLIMDIQSLGDHDILHNIKINDENLIDTITTTGQYSIADSVESGVSKIQFRLTHDITETQSSFIIKFLLGNREISDLSSFFPLDSDGDGLSDLLEESPYNIIPDIDNDGIPDGSDLMPYNSINCASRERYRLLLPIYDINSEVEISIQIKPTEHDYKENLELRGNKLLIMPALRIYSDVFAGGGDYLPDNSFSIDNGRTGLIQLAPLRSVNDEDIYSWATTLSYKSGYEAQQDHQIELRFSLEWLIYEYNPITEESSLYHIYENYDEFTIQGIAVTENRPTNVVVGILDDGQSYRKTITNAELAAHLCVSNINYNPNDIVSLEFQNAIIDDINILNNTRDNLRSVILSDKKLTVETTNFIYLTYGYVVTYTLDALNDEFEDFSQDSFEDSDIDRFYSREDTKFKGIIITKLLRDNYEEFVTKFVFGWKCKDLETIRFDLQFLKYKYVGSSCSEIFLLEGFEETKRVLMCTFDFEENFNMITIATIGHFEYFSNVKVLDLSLKGPETAEPGNFWDDIKGLGEIYTWYASYFEHVAVQTILKAIDLFLVVSYILIETKILIESGSQFGELKVWSKIAAVLSIVFGGMRFGYGINLIMQGAFNTGASEMMRGGLMAIAGVFTLIPTGFTQFAGAVLFVICLFDWIADMAGFDLFGWYFDIWGIEDANPDYEIIESEILPETPFYANTLGGFRVGNQIRLRMNVKNTGNTRLKFYLKVKAGTVGTPYYEYVYYLEPGETRVISASEDFEEACALNSITVTLGIEWFFHGSSGGPQYSSFSDIFDIAVFPRKIGDFVTIIKNEEWYPRSKIFTGTTVIDDEIVPRVSEQLEYKIDIVSIFDKACKYEIQGSNTDLWTYYIETIGIIETKDWKFSFHGSYFNTGYLVISPHIYDVDYITYSFYIRVSITPTTVNPLNPGDFNVKIRIQNQDFSFERKDVILDFTIKPLIDFEVEFDPILIQGLNLGGNSYLPYSIDVTNIGGIDDTYSVEIEDLDEDLFELQDSELSVCPGDTDSSLIEFFIPWSKIVLPGEISFKIKVSSEADPNLIKIYKCILNIQDYHRMSLNIESPFLNMSDSDIFNYNLHLTNLGNVEVPFTISWTDVSFANTFIEESSFNIAPGQYENFNVSLIPFELGFENFTITASTPFISSTVDASIFVYDDDTHAPVVVPETVEIADNCHFLNISFEANDLLEGDDIGIGSINIYVDDASILNYMPNPYETIFNFSLPNDWIMEYGNHTIQIEVTDADNDRLNDALTTILVESFEVTPDEMMEYILWELSELKDYINNELEFCFNRPLVNSLENTQCKIQKALDYYNSGRITKSVLFNMLAKARLEFYDIITYMLLKHDKITEEIGDYISTEVHKIRDHLSLTMGGIVGTEVALEIADIIVEISQFTDNISFEQNLDVFLSIDQHLWRAVDELDFVLVLMSADWMKECLILKHISNSICKLELTITKIQHLEVCGRITEAKCLTLCEEIDVFITKLNNILEIL